MVRVSDIQSSQLCLSASLYNSSAHKVRDSKPSSCWFVHQVCVLLSMRDSIIPFTGGQNGIRIYRRNCRWSGDAKPPQHLDWWVFARYRFVFNFVVVVFSTQSFRTDWHRIWFQKIRREYADYKIAIVYVTVSNVDIPISRWISSSLCAFIFVPHQSKCEEN